MKIFKTENEQINMEKEKQGEQKQKGKNIPRQIKKNDIVDRE